jgi:hypothetical protein
MKFFWLCAVYEARTSVNIWPAAGDPVYIILVTLGFSKYEMVIDTGGTFVHS